MVIAGHSAQEAREYKDGVLEFMVGTPYIDAAQGIPQYGAIARHIIDDYWEADNKDLDGQRAYFVIFGWLDDNDFFTKGELAYEVPL